MLDELLARFRQGDRRALSRLLSMASLGEPMPDAASEAATKHARVVAFTGSAGVGKSTLVGKLIELVRRQGLTVAVLACDPQSPLSGGALLGDRFRMPSQPDDGIFIRSVAAAGERGAIADHLTPMIQLLERFGFDVIFIETVGAGQGDTTVRLLVDAVVLLLQPEAGDELQWEKAGILEIADVVVVQKADLPGAETAEAQVRTILGLSRDRDIPVMRVSAKTGECLEKLWQTIAACPLRRRDTTLNGEELLRRAQKVLAQRFAIAERNGDPVLHDILERYCKGELNASDAASEVLRLLR